MPSLPLAPAPPRASGCGAWSAHAGDLARRIAGELAAYPDGPSTRSCARHDGLVPLRDGVWAHPASLLTMPDRAVAIGCALGADLSADLVVAGLSAAWVLTGVAPPPLLELVTTARPRALAGTRIRQVEVSPAEVEAIGGCPVTIPVRTAIDVLRFAADDALALRAVEALLRSGHADPRAIDRRLASCAALPHLRRARARWSAVSATGV